MKVLVTGADGFIGSHLTEELVKKGYQVKAFVYYNSFNNWGWLDTLPQDILKNVEVLRTKRRIRRTDPRRTFLYGTLLRQ